MLSLSGLQVATAGGVAVIDDITLSLPAGEIVAVVGESGSGKTTLGLAALGWVGDGLGVTAGHVHVDDASLFELTERQLGLVRGTRISYVAQHPGSALNPALRIGAQLRTVIRAHHRGLDDRELATDIEGVLEEVSLPASPDLLRRYPHQLSGGQQQRVTLAIALACRPDVIVLDEPTSDLDAVTRSQVIGTIRQLSRSRSLAVLCISHDLTLVSSLADQVAVMYAGSVVEQGPVGDVLARPAHPYTRHLVAAWPDRNGRRRMVGLDGIVPVPGRRPSGCRFAPRCELAHADCVASQPLLVAVADRRQVRCVEPFAVPPSLEASDRPLRTVSGRSEPVLRLRRVSAAYRGVDVLHDVTIDVGRGEWLALVGGSGAGKTTLLRTIAGLHREFTGTVELDGVALRGVIRDRQRNQRQAIQAVFQHPFESFNPRRTIGDSVSRPLLIGGSTRSRARHDVHALLERVGLDASLRHRYPSQLSGGELQRAAVARALAGRPRVLLCDEVTSSLDTLVQASIVGLLAGLRADLGLSIVFVTHDLAVVASVAERTAVMWEGRIVEAGETSRLFREARHPHTRALLGSGASVEDGENPAPPV